MTARNIVTYALLTVILTATVVLAEPYSEPSGTPLGSNAMPVVTTDTVPQVKTGVFWADSLGADSGSGRGICIGTDCRTAWPAGSPKQCRLDWKEVHAANNGNYADWGNLAGFNPVSGLCDDMLTPQSKAAGWVATGNDYCMRIGSSDCQRPRSCIFTRLNCSGVTVQQPTTELLIHPASNPTDEFQTINPGSGSQANRRLCIPNFACFNLP